MTTGNIVLQSYGDFLRRSVTALVASGAQPVAGPGVAGSRPAWMDGWDGVLLAHAPGSVTVYAFTSVDPNSIAGLQHQLNALAAGLSVGIASSNQPLQLIAVAVCASGVDPRLGRRIARLTPAQYYPRLRPRVLVVDLPSRRVYGAPRFRRSDEVNLLLHVVSGDISGDVLDDADATRQGTVQLRQTSDFYRLMQGRQPYVTYVLIALNVFIFVLLYQNGGPQSETALRSFGALSPRLVEDGQWWRLFTSMFLHASVAHILFNMTSLYAVGTLTERLYGSLKFLGIYLGAGLVGSLVSFGYAVVTGQLDVLGVGASGAIFGVAGALLTIRFQPSEAIPRSVRYRISSSMLPLVAISLGMSYLTPHVDNSAHIGGLIGGILLSFLLPLTRAVAPTSR